MKRILNIFSIFSTLLLTSFILMHESSPLDGTWELKDFNYGGEKGSNPSPRTVKMFEDGKFGVYLFYPNGPKKTTDGKFTVLDSNYYTESIVDAVNTPMIGMTYKIKYQIQDTSLVMSGTFHNASGEVSYSETWIKVNPKILASVHKRPSLLSDLLWQ